MIAVIPIKLLYMATKGLILFLAIIHLDVLILTSLSSFQKMNLYVISCLQTLLNLSIIILYFVVVCRKWFYLVVEMTVDTLQFAWTVFSDHVNLTVLPSCHNNYGDLTLLLECLWHCKLIASAKWSLSAMRLHCFWHQTIPKLTSHFM